MAQAMIGERNTADWRAFDRYFEDEALLLPVVHSEMLLTPDTHGLFCEPKHS